MTDNDIKKISEQIANSISLDVSCDITLEKAECLVQKVMQRATEIGVKAVVAVADSHCNPVLCKSMDGALVASWDVAFNKAFTVTSLKMSTSKLSTLTVPGGSLYGIQFTNNGRIVIFGGGEPLIDKNGRIVGGLGVSGGTEGQDTSLAEYGKEVFKQI